MDTDRHREKTTERQEKVAFYQPRRSPKKKQTLVTPWSWTSSLQNVRIWISLFYFIQCVVHVVAFLDDWYTGKEVTDTLKSSAFDFKKASYQGGSFVPHRILITWPIFRGVSVDIKTFDSINKWFVCFL